MLPETLSAVLAPLETHERVGLNLIGKYWSPEKEGETRRLYFVKIDRVERLKDEDTGETEVLPTAIFVDPLTKEVVYQSSARLVGFFERVATDKNQGFEIVYKGKRRNSTNAFMSDDWEVYKLKSKV